MLTCWSCKQDVEERATLRITPAVTHNASSSATQIISMELISTTTDGAVFFLQQRCAYWKVGWNLVRRPVLANFATHFFKVFVVDDSEINTRAIAHSRHSLVDFTFAAFVADSCYRWLLYIS
jgi:hypothetical protein